MNMPFHWFEIPIYVTHFGSNRGYMSVFDLILQNVDSRPNKHQIHAPHISMNYLEMLHVQGSLDGVGGPQEQPHFHAFVTLAEGDPP